jgi:hypothetical protein
MVCNPCCLQIAVCGKSFNHSARDAWELFQSTGVEALVAYDCSGAVLLMGTLLGGLVTGTCSGVWTWIKWRDKMSMVGSTAMLMGMVLVSISPWTKLVTNWLQKKKKKKYTITHAHIFVTNWLLKFMVNWKYLIL